MGFCNCSMFCCTLILVHSSFAIILMGKRELVALLSLSSWCLVIAFLILIFGEVMEEKHPGAIVKLQQL